MSDLKPRGIPVKLAGVERKLLFTLNAIDAVESKYEEPILDVLEKMFKPETQNKTVKDIIIILLEDEEEREKYFHPDAEMRKITEKEVGWEINALNRDDFALKIIQAYGLTMPKAEEEDPNRESGQK